MGRLLRFFLFFFCLAFTSCGYHVGQGDLPNRYHTLSIPYATGDTYGDLTASLVREFARSGAFQYKQSHAELSLLVAVIDVTDENVGFRYDRDKKGKRTDWIIPTETRITALAEVSVVECSSGCTVLGPARITAWVDFDHEYYFGSYDDNIFSLGQLTDYDAAFDAVQRPLNRALAKKIVDYVTQSW